MPRKQRFKPTRKPKLTNESAAIEQIPPAPTSNDEVVMARQPPPIDEERRTE